MSMINVSNLTFSYDGNPENIFENVSFIIDTNWKLGFIGRNGKGKTTFLNLLRGQYDYSGSILANVNFDYFPFKIENPDLSSYEIAEKINNKYEKWQFEREMSLLDMNLEKLSNSFSTLSEGEKTKVLLAILFLKENNFLLIDEPTNHLDIQARESVAKYLKRKKGFILVSHDRNFLDVCVDHILSINRANIEIQQGNFSTWWKNKIKQDIFETKENEKLRKDISRLEKSARQSANWAGEIEASKYNIRGDLLQDKGFIGHKSAKMMKRSIVTQKRRQKAIEEKSQLLKNIETSEELKLNLLPNRKGKIVEANKLSIIYDGMPIFDNVDFSLESGERLQLKGKNGCGKSSIIKLILGCDIDYKGTLNINKNIKISYVSQEPLHFTGSLKEYARKNSIEESLFKSILRKLDFEREQFDKKLESYSEGQKKKVLIAKSLCEQANLYIWDEPLNYVDIFSRMQIENVILEYCPTMIFVEHDEEFAKKIATKTLTIIRNNEKKKDEEK